MCNFYILRDTNPKRRNDVHEKQCKHIFSSASVIKNRKAKIIVHIAVERDRGYDEIDSNDRKITNGHSHFGHRRAKNGTQFYRNAA